MAVGYRELTESKRPPREMATHLCELSPVNLGGCMQQMPEEAGCECAAGTNLAEGEGS